MEFFVPLCDALRSSTGREPQFCEPERLVGDVVYELAPDLGARWMLFGGNGGRDGYTVGGGLEYLFTQNWSGKVEYQYYDLGTVNFVGPVGAAGTFRNDQHTIKVGLNYRFNWGAPMGAPLAPGY